MQLELALQRPQPRRTEPNFGERQNRCVRASDLLPAVLQRAFDMTKNQTTTTTKPQKSAVEMGPGFAPSEVLALSKVSPKDNCDTARTHVKAGVYPINITVQVTGDIEVRADYLRAENLDTAPILFAALARMKPEERQALYKKPTCGEREGAIIEAELGVLKAGLPRHWTNGVLVPHLRVQSVHDVHGVHTAEQKKAA